jgi:predicted ArsR family transcriptional regulator
MATQDIPNALQTILTMYHPLKSSEWVVDFLFRLVPHYGEQIIPMFLRMLERKVNESISQLETLKRDLCFFATQTPVPLDQVDVVNSAITQVAKKMKEMVKLHTNISQRMVVPYLDT